MHQDCSTPTSDVTLLSAKLQTLHTDVADIKGSIKELTSAINKLALVEERISNAVATAETELTPLERLEKQLAELQSQLDMLKSE